MIDPQQEGRRQVLAAVCQLVAWGLVAGTSGNASLRLPPADGRDLIAITPSQRPYDQLTPEDLLVVDFEGEPVLGNGVPSSETLMHVATYRARPDIQAVVHTHSIFASVAAVQGREIPPIVDELVVTVGGAVQVARYAFPGTQELADAAVEALGERKAVLLRHHGLLSAGRTLQEALDVSLLVERVAQVFVYASLSGEVAALSPEVVEAEQSIYRMRVQAEQGNQTSGG